MLKSLVFLMLFSTFAIAKCPSEIVIGWEDYPPFQFKKDGEVAGVDIDLSSAIFTKMGCKFKFQEIPWARHLKLLEAGKVHVAMSASKNPEREKFAIFPNPYREGKTVLFVKKGDEASVTSMKKLEEIKGRDGFMIGAIKAYSYGGDYVKLKEDGEFRKHIRLGKNIEEVMGMLVKGEINTYPADIFVGSDKAKKTHPGKIAATDFIVSSSGAYIMFTKKGIDTAFIDNFNSTLKALQDDGTIQKIIDKYTK